MSPIRRTPGPVALAATAACALSFGAATSAEAAVPCFKTYAAGWKVQNDGSLQGALHNSGSAGDQNHGRLAVGGVAYPQLDGNLCAQSTAGMSMPTRNLGGYTVSRSVAQVGGKLRWLDTITNPGAGKMVTVDVGLEVLASQVIKTSESGNDSADEDDHWTVHQSTSLFSTHQWGQKSSIAQPTVLPEDGGPRWEDDFGDMDDDATLKYSFFIGASQTVRLVHATGTAASLQAAKDSAADAAGLFAGLSRTVADDVVNFSDDPDGDGVTKFSDDCPSVKGAKANGCAADVVPPPADPVDPVDPQAPAPPNGGEQPAPAPNGEQPGSPSGTGGTGGSPSAAADTAAPKVTIGRVGKTLRRTKLTQSKGTKASVLCSEECRFTAKLVVKPRGSKKLRTVQTINVGSFSAGTRDVRLKVKKTKLVGLAKQRVTLVVEATDRAGNRTAVEQRISLR